MMPPADAPSPTPVHRLAKMLRPLANPRRLELLLYLRQPRYVEEVASYLRVTRQAASQHVEALRAVGIVERRASTRPGKNVVEYYVRSESLADAYGFFEELVVQVVPAALSPLETRGTPIAHGGSSRLLAGPHLVVVHGLELGRQFPLAPRARARSWLVGRAAPCDVRVASDAYVSSRHAEVRAVEDGFALVDLRSRNGTLVNWERAPPGEPCPLGNGDVIGVGRTLLLLRS